MKAIAKMRSAMERIKVDLGGVESPVCQSFVDRILCSQPGEQELAGFAQLGLTADDVRAVTREVFGIRVQ